MNDKNEITEEDMNIINMTDDPEFDEKFRAVMLKYLYNARIDCIREQNKKVRKEWREQLDAIEYFIYADNWLIRIPAGFRENSIEERRKKFADMLESIGMIEQYKLHSKLTANEFAKKMNRCYYRIVEIQEDRRKRTGIRGIISKIKGALFS